MILVRIFADDGVGFSDHELSVVFLPDLLSILCQLGVRYDVRPIDGYAK